MKNPERAPPQVELLTLLSAVIWPLLQRSQVLPLLATLGLSLILEQMATSMFGAHTKLVPRRASERAG